ncbi:MAG: hypothetical protein WC144_01260 [Sulfurimonas sp.]|jgi:LAS superfamily LD-carboxypeptidase LdcB|nr:hypothetical protein [Sulfurimonadaceae bacterium]
MFKKIVIMSAIVASLSAYDLKENMQMLNAELLEVQQGFIISDPDMVDRAIKKFSKHAQDLLGDKDKFAQMLPANKKHRANEAVMSAQIINHNVNIILEAIENKANQSGIARREESQRAFTYIEHACFRCHNLVRDRY